MGVVILRPTFNWIFIEPDQGSVAMISATSWPDFQAAAGPKNTIPMQRA